MIVNSKISNITTNSEKMKMLFSVFPLIPIPDPRAKAKAPLRTRN
uniref:Uncharacterized protein n=1 Tax=Rhizophora mucronata TaxID=61149 RepID=A0A2P2M0M2_RHIMU